VLDIAVQAHVARRSGLDVGRLEIMHLNRACAYPDLGNWFIRADVTEMAKLCLRLQRPRMGGVSRTGAQGGGDCRRRG